MKDLDKKIIEKRNLDNNFFNPLNDINLPYDPSDIKNISKAKEMLFKYIDDKSKILIVADPDIDGIMSSSIMYQWLNNIHKNVKIIHHQRNKGHGVISDKIENVDLLIIVDSSSNSVSEVEDIIKSKKAKEVLILDHHETDNRNTITEYIREYNNEGYVIETPVWEDIAVMNMIGDNVVLINPHQPGDEYPNKNVSGALLTLKFIEYCEKFIDYKFAYKLIDLAAISIISDVMSVSEMENRYYYYKGSSLIQNIGLASLLDVLGISSANISSNDIGFKLNKTLNSLLRLQDIRTIFKLILQYKSEEDINIIDRIIKAVKQRESLEQEIISSITVLQDSKGVLLARNNYNGIDSISGNFNGVIASKMADENKKNIIIVNDKLSGSARAFKDYRFKDYINESKYANGQGHQGAFGIKINDLENFNQYILDHPPVFKIDDEYEIELTIKDLSKNLFNQVEELQYLVGNGFERIRFMLKDIKINDIKKTTGGNKYYILDKPKNYIRFLDKSLQETEIKKGNICNLYFTMRINNFFGKDYYECECYHIEIVSDEIDDEWGFIDE